MTKLLQPVQRLMPIVAIMLLCLFFVPTAQSNGNNGGTTSTQQNTLPTTAEDAKTVKPKPKATTKPQNKSVLDTEVLDSPISYFKKAFSSEEEETDTSSSSGAVIITVKALIATLLSTIM